MSLNRSKPQWDEKCVRTKGASDGELGPEGFIVHVRVPFALEVISGAEHRRRRGVFRGYC